MVSMKKKKTDKKKLAILPSILTEDMTEAASQLQLAAQAGLQTVQIDIIDGFYADNLTLTPADYAFLDFDQLNADFHLMVEEPMDYVYELIDFKAQLPIRVVIAQIEKMSSQENYVKLVRDQGWQVGLSLDLYTPLDSIDEEVLSKLDVIQVMSVEAGQQGQKFSEHIWSLIDQVVEYRAKNQFDFQIIVDGGINVVKMKKLKKLGVDSVAIGSALWQSDDFAATYAKMNQVC